MTKYKRSTYLIDRSFQLKYFVLTVALLFLHTLVVLAAVFGPTVHALYSDFPIEKKAEAARTILLLHDTIWPGILATIILFGIVSIFITHKIAGPIFRIVTDLRRIISGDYSVRIRLRKGDELKALADHINLLSVIVCETRTLLAEKHLVMKQALDELKQEYAEGTLDRAAVLGIIDRIEAESDGIWAVIHPVSPSAEALETGKD